jgi:hypothetical protein
MATEILRINTDYPRAAIENYDRFILQRIAEDRSENIAVSNNGDAWWIKPTGRVPGITEMNGILPDDCLEDFVNNYKNNWRLQSRLSTNKGAITVRYGNRQLECYVISLDITQRSGTPIGFRMGLLVDNEIISSNVNGNNGSSITIPKPEYGLESNINYGREDYDQFALLGVQLSYRESYSTAVLTKSKLRVMSYGSGIMSATITVGYADSIIKGPASPEVIIMENILKGMMVSPNNKKYLTLKYGNEQLTGYITQLHTPQSTDIGESSTATIGMIVKEHSFVAKKNGGSGSDQ